MRTSCGSGDACTRQDDNALRLAALYVLSNRIEATRSEVARGHRRVEEGGLFLPHLAVSSNATSVLVALGPRTLGVLVAATPSYGCG